MSAKSRTTSAPETNIQSQGHESNFKKQLDQAAYDARNPGKEQPKQNTIIDKAASRILGSPQKDSEEKASQPSSPGPTKRLGNDVQVEEFIRQQHRSKGEDGSLE